VERIVETRQLAILVGVISRVLVDLGMPPIVGIPRDLCVACDILEEVGTILKCLWEAYASSHSPWD
jgi:hypothetical protein